MNDSLPDSSESGLFQNIPLQNTELAQELEVACKKSPLGVLTYAEYVAIDQFGKNGYHARFEKHGMTNVSQLWPESIFSLCKKYGISHIAEFGPGDGELAAHILELGRQHNFPLQWSGVEISAYYQKMLKQRNLSSVFSRIEDLAIPQKSLCMFMYSLDSVPPEIFVTASPVGYPNAILGISVENGFLSEVLLTPKQLEELGITFENGIFTNQEGKRFDLRSWTLLKRQRAYIPVPAFSLLSKWVEKMPLDSHILIADEFSLEPLPQEFHHLCVPKILNINQRYIPLANRYEESGQHLLYYPTFVYTLETVLKSLGFSKVLKNHERKIAKALINESFYEDGPDFTVGILAGPKTSKPSSLITVGTFY